MPAEWEPHAATWLAWPHDPVTWPGRVDRVERVFAQMAAALAPGERVEILVRDAKMEARARTLIAEAGANENLRFHHVPTADSWIRDYGPIFVRRQRPTGRKETAYVDWRFNAWGDKYEPLKADDDVPTRLQPVIDRRLFTDDLVLEGGSIEVNGRGVLLTTEQCLLNPNRNPQLSRAEIEARLEEFLGVRKVLWLAEGIEGDDTDGHIDDLARFVNPFTIVCALEEDPTDPNYGVLRANYERLRRFTDAEGQAFRVVPLPMPGRVEADDGRLPASYTNFYIGNRVVLLPVFGDPNDARAERVLADQFPTRRIVPIPSADLIWGFGAVHCVTQQQPAE